MTTDACSLRCAERIRFCLPDHEPGELHWYVDLGIPGDRYWRFATVSRFLSLGEAIFVRPTQLAGDIHKFCSPGCARAFLERYIAYRCRHHGKDFTHYPAIFLALEGSGSPAETAIHDEYGNGWRWPDYWPPRNDATKARRGRGGKP